MKNGVSFPAKVSVEGELVGFYPTKDDLKILFGGHDVEVLVRRKKKIRSLALNSYYWSEVVPKIQEGLKQTGERLSLDETHDWIKDFFSTISKEQTHDFLKDRFIEKVTVDEDSGEIIENEMTTKIEREAFWNYIEHIIQFAAENLEVQIYYPKEQSKLGLQ